MDTTFGIVLGAVLALATSFVMELVRGWIADRRARRLFSAVLRVEVPGIVATLDGLADDYGKLGYFYIIAVGQLQTQRAGYERHRTALVLLEDALRDQVIDFYQRCAVLAQEVTGAEQLLLARPDQRDFVELKRVEFAGRLRDLAGRGRELGRGLGA